MPITINGTSGISGVDGSAGTPALQGSDSNTGISFGTDEVNINTGGNTRATVDSSGRLLVGTTSADTGPTARVAHVQVAGNSTGNTGGYLTLSRGATPTASEQVLGGVSFTDGASEYGLIVSTSEGTPTASSKPARLEFRTTPSGSTSPVERLRITSNGNIQAGGGSAQTGERILSFCTAGVINGYGTIPTTNASYSAFVFRNFSNSAIGSIECTTSTTAYNTSSDYRLKENVVPLTGAVDRLNQLQVHRFNFIADPDTTVDGFIAHEAQEVVPECVTGTHNEVDDDGNPVYQGIDQSKLVPLLTAALQEALAKIETLETRLTALEGGTNP